MRVSSPLRGALSALFALSLLLGGCARRLPDVDPSQIPTLRQALEADPDDAEIRTRLGIAQYRAGRYDQAVANLEQAIIDGAEGGAAYLYLGLAQEELENWEAARNAYAGYVSAGGSGELRDEIEARLALMVRRELQAEASRALAREAELSDEPPAPRSVAVLPFRLVSDREELEPLQVAMADMVITDLTLAGDLTVLERAQIQALLNEMALTEAGYADAATGARAGRLLQAEHVVQGALTTLGDDLIRFDGDVLNTVGGRSQGDLEDQNALEAIFDLEKEVVFGVLDVLGIEITAAEREAIDENRSESLLAFLAYGQGLEAMDRGDYGQAVQFFQQAVELDPGFEAAQQQQQSASMVQAAASTPTTQVAQQGITELETGGLGSLDQIPGDNTLASTLENIDEGVNPNPTAGTIDLGTAQGGSGSAEQPTNQQRDPVQEAQGQETPTSAQTSRIILTIPRPGGGN